MGQYLYGASLQGLQEFIFKTNKLREIVGGSEIIKTFDEIDLKAEFHLSTEPDVILKAAGNLRVIFDNESDVKKVVKYLPKKILQSAYGVNLSQSVVVMSEYKSASAKLEKNLKIARNKIALPLDTHLSICAINPRTGLSAIEKDGKEMLDTSVKQKLQAFNEAVNKNKALAQDINAIKNKKNKIAVIHIDGNGLGGIVRGLEKDEMKAFSQKLDSATKEAYKQTLESIIDSNPTYQNALRDIILGGDDVTLICNANIALDLSEKFLENFELKTQNIHKQSSLTACAGIAYCNEKFPFFYAVKLAEDLCAYAKKDAKEINPKLPPSCLMFHNIQGSYVEGFSQFLDEELSINSVRCDFGPYYLRNIENKPSIRAFKSLIQDFKKDNSPKGRLRDWLSSLQFNKEYAKAESIRIAEIFKGKWESKNLATLHKELSLANLILMIDNVEKTPIYDILQILSVQD